VDRGLFVSSCYKTITYEEKKRNANVYETIEVPPVNIRIKKYNYCKLGENGIVKKGTRVYKDDVLIGKTLTKSFKDIPDQKTDVSMIVTNGYEGVVDMVYEGTNLDGYKIIKIKIRSLRIPEVGDKLASRSAQKGTIGMVLNQEDMPYTEEGIVPDIIMNIHALPSRMTLSQLIECLLGKKCSLAGDYSDATAFTDWSKNPVEVIAKELESFGYEKYGNEVMYNGFTGERIKTKIFIGPTFYQRLKHLVNDKIHSRAYGQVTMLSRQPQEGRSKEGGLRLGKLHFARVCVKVLIFCY
jgi:DNA-directed RNA polymerase II subunit RPB2